MKNLFHSRDAASKAAALIIVLAMVVLLAGIALAYFSRTTTDRQVAQSSYNDTSADLLARTALDIVVNDFKQEILSHPTVTPAPPFYMTPVPYGTPATGQAPIPNLIRRSFFADPTGRTSTINSSTASANGRWISGGRWNSHYLIPVANPSCTIVPTPSPTVTPAATATATPSPTSTPTPIILCSDPIPSFVPPDWVLVTAQGPAPNPTPSTVIGRYAFAVYDEGGLLDMSLAGYPSWSGAPTGVCNPAPTPWLINVGRKGTTAFADLTALGLYGPPQTLVDKIVGWRNYATTNRTFNNFPGGNPGFSGETNCGSQNNYGSYLLYFGDPPFTIESLSDKLTASLYPFTAVATEPDGSNTRTDQSLMTRQQLLKLQRDVGFSPNLLQYMGTFSRERNWPAPDWPNLNGTLSEGRFNMNNLGLVVPNPGDCTLANGKKKGWQTGKNRNHLCGTPNEIIELFGLFWVKAAVIDPNFKTPGHWRYINHTGPNPPGDPDPNPHSIICFRGANQQEDFFQILHYALNIERPTSADRCAGRGQQARTFAIGASLIDQYDSGADCITFPPSSWANTGCDLDSYVVTNNGNNLKYATHTTVIEYGQGSGNGFGYGMEPSYSTDVGSDGNTNGDCPPGASGHGCAGAPHLPTPAPAPAAGTQVISHAFSNVGEFGYGVDTSTAGLPTMDFSSPNFYDAPVLDFFSYNPISSVYPRAGIINLYTRNAPVLAAMLAGTVKFDAATKNAAPPPWPVPSPTIAPNPATTSEAMQAANAIVCETQWVLTGTNPPGCSAAPGWAVTQTDMTRAIAARLAARAARDVSTLATSDETEKAVARALAEVGQTRTWNLLIDVIAQTGKYKPNSDLSGSNFVVEGEKRYWLHIALGRDLICPDGTPYRTNDATSCSQSQATVDVLGTQLEEVIE